MRGLWLWCRRFFLFAWFLFLLLCGAWLASDNPEPISPILLGINFPELSLGIYISCLLLIGLLLGFFSTFLVTQGRMISRKRELSRARKELESLRSSHT